MKFALFRMAVGDTIPWDEQTPEQQAATLQQHSDFGSACAARDGVTILAGEALDGTPTVVRHRGGERTVTEGPFAESVEQLGGFYLIETPDLQTLLELTTFLPPYDLQFSSVGEE